MENQLWGIITLIICSVCCALALKNAKSEKFNYSLLLLVITGLLLRLYVGSDLFLHEWDERYHALVAKNFLKHPLVPTLYDKVFLPYDYTSWTSNHIWLHKPPMTMWIMALGLKIFGLNEIALRIPTILFSTLAIALTYYIAKYYFDKKTALLAAFFHSINGLILETTAGRVTTDHVDSLFLFFIELAIFLTICFVKREKFYWNVLVGFTLGLAILTKWLPALIVLPIWIFLSYDSGKFNLKQLSFNFLLILISCALIVVPWQLYILTEFPLEAKWETLYSVRHFTENIEDHAAPAFYYLDKIRIIYGELIYLPLIWFLIVLIQKKNLRLISLFIWFFIPLIFFSCAKTKMQGYLMFTSPAVFIMLSSFCFYLNLKKITVGYKHVFNLIIVLLILLPVRYSIERSKPFLKTDRNPPWTNDLRNLKHKITDPNAIIFNIEKPIEAMFYIENIVYPFIPTLEQIELLTKNGMSIYIHEDINIPENIRKIPGIKLFEF